MAHRRGAWEQQQHLANLKQQALKIPTLDHCKPLYFATHISSNLLLLKNNSGVVIDTDNNDNDNIKACLCQLIKVDSHLVTNQVLIMSLLIQATIKEKDSYDQLLGLHNSLSTTAVQLVAIVEELNWSWVLFTDTLLCFPIHHIIRFVNQTESLLPEIVATKLASALITHSIKLLEDASVIDAIDSESILLLSANIEVFQTIQQLLLLIPLSSSSSDSSELDLQQVEELLKATDKTIASVSTTLEMSIKSEVFQCLCQLRARLSLVLATCDNTLGMKSVPAADNNNAVNFDVCKNSDISNKLWKQVMHIDDDAGNIDDVTSLSITISSLCVATAMTLIGDEYNSNAVIKDPNPICAATLAYSVLCMLCRDHSSILQSPLLLVELLTLLVQLIDSNDHRVAILDKALGSSSTQDSSKNSFREYIDSNQAVQEYWSKALVAITNKLTLSTTNTNSSSTNIVVFGKHIERVEESARAFMLPSIFNPKAAIDHLVTSAIQGAIQLDLSVGIFNKLLPLKHYRDSKDDACCCHLLEVLRQHLVAASAGDADEAHSTALIKLVTELSREDTNCSATTATHRSLTKEVDSSTMLEYAVLPALTCGSNSTTDKSILFTCSCNLLDIIIVSNTATKIPHRGVKDSVLEELAKHAMAVVDWRQRRLDLSSAGLRLSSSAMESALKLVHQAQKLLLDTTNKTTALSSSITDLKQLPTLRFQSLSSHELYPLLADTTLTICQILLSYTTLYESKQQQSLRHALLHSLQLGSTSRDYHSTIKLALCVSLAVIVPCSTIIELNSLMDQGVRSIISELLLSVGNHRSSNNNREAELSIAMIETLCRSLNMLALVPELVTIESESNHHNHQQQQQQPGELTRAAVSRMLQRLATWTRHHYTCNILETTNNNHKGEVALGMFIQICRCIASIQSYYDCTVVSMTLVYLTQQTFLAAVDSTDEERQRMKQLMEAESSVLDEPMRTTVHMAITR